MEESIKLPTLPACAWKVGVTTPCLAWCRCGVECAAGRYPKRMWPNQGNTIEQTAQLAHDAARNALRHCAKCEAISTGPGPCPRCDGPDLASLSSEDLLEAVAQNSLSLAIQRLEALPTTALVTLLN